MVGVNFATAFIRADGRRDADTTLEELIRHVDYLIEHVGEDHVGLGSDFDGATIPAAIGDARGLPRLVDAMRQHGYDEALVAQDLPGATGSASWSGPGAVEGGSSPLPACGERVSAFGRNKRSEAKRG